MPPSRASAIASSDSVTVSMAALTIGMLTTMFRENRERTSTSRGWRSESRGTSKTSSNVRASLPTLSAQATRWGAPRSAAAGRSGETFSAHVTRWLTSLASSPDRAIREGWRAAPAGPRGSGPGQWGRLLLLLHFSRLEVIVGADAQVEGQQPAVEPRPELLVPPRERQVTAGGDLDRGRGQHLQESLHAELSARPRVEPPVTPEGHRVLDDIAAVLHPDAVDTRSGPDIVQPLLPSHRALELDRHRNQQAEVVPLPRVLREARVCHRHGLALVVAG